jgi:hypothetical protein
MENILIYRLGPVNDQTIFVVSCLYLIPGIPFPMLIGKLMDKTKKYKEIVLYLLLVQVVSQTIFLFTTNIWGIYISSSINSITSACLSSALLTLIHQLLLPESDQVYNNLTFSLSFLVTWVAMFFPMSTSNYNAMYSSLTILSFAGIGIYYYSLFK